MEIFINFYNSIETVLVKGVFGIHLGRWKNLEHLENSLNF